MPSQLSFTLEEQAILAFFDIEVPQRSIDDVIH